MKYLLLCLLPLVFCAPRDKRILIDELNSLGVFDLEILKCDLQIMVDVLGSDPSEHACEDECHLILQEGHFLNYACPLVCLGFQSLIHTLDIVPEGADSTDPCARDALAATEVPVKDQSTKAQ